MNFVQPDGRERKKKVRAYDRCNARHSFDASVARLTDCTYTLYVNFYSPSKLTAFTERQRVSRTNGNTDNKRSEHQHTHKEINTYSTVQEAKPHTAQTASKSDICYEVHQPHFCPSHQIKITEQRY